MTNFDKLKEKIMDMSIDEFFRLLKMGCCTEISADFCYRFNNCDDCQRQWLISEVK